MSFKIMDFKSSISKLGVQKTSHYSGTIIFPSALSTTVDTKELSMRINSLNLPGANIQTDDIKHTGFGLSEKRPVQLGYEDITFTIIADARGKIHNDLHKWIQLVFPTVSDENSSKDLEYFEYPNNYYGGLEIYLYDSTGKKHTTYTFIHPYIVSIGSSSLSWENTDSLVLIPVTFAYRSCNINTTYKGQSE